MNMLESWWNTVTPAQFLCCSHITQTGSRRGKEDLLLRNWSRESCCGVSVCCLQSGLDSTSSAASFTNIETQHHMLHMVFLWVCSLVRPCMLERFTVPALWHSLHKPERVVVCVMKRCLHFTSYCCRGVWEQKWCRSKHWRQSDTRHLINTVMLRPERR